MTILSYAVGTPVVALFSSRDYPGKWYPPDDGKNIVIRNDALFCNKCVHDEVQENACMKGISVERVIKSGQKILEFQTQNSIRR